jgi:hypothetical protein
VQTEQRSDELAQKTQIALDRAKVTTLPLWRDASETGVDLMMKNGRTLPLTILIGPDGSEIARLSGLELGPGGKNIWESKDAATFFQKSTPLDRDEERDRRASAPHFAKALITAKISRLFAAPRPTGADRTPATDGFLPGRP